MFETKNLDNCNFFAYQYDEKIYLKMLGRRSEIYLNLNSSRG